MIGLLTLSAKKHEASTEATIGALSSREAPASEEQHRYVLKRTRLGPLHRDGDQLRRSEAVGLWVDVTVRR